MIHFLYLPYNVTQKDLPNDFDKIRNHPDFTIIGHATETKDNFLIARGSNQLIPLTAQGWDAFLNKE